MTETTSTEFVQEKVLADKLLRAMASSWSKTIDTFLGWLLGGTGATIALLVSNLSELDAYISLEEMRLSVFLFFIALGVAVLEKYLAATVGAGTEVAEFSTKEGEKLGAAAARIEFKEVFKEIEKATFYPARWIVRRNLRKVLAGDLVLSGRLYALLAQIQGILTVLVICFIAAGFIRSMI